MSCTGLYLDHNRSSARVLSKGGILFEFCFSSKYITQAMLLDVVAIYFWECIQAESVVKFGVR